MANFNFVKRIKKNLGVKSKKAIFTYFNRSYSQGFSNKNFADNENQPNYDEIALVIRLYVIYIQNVVRKHYEKNHDPPMARSKAMIVMSHYGIDRLAKKCEKFPESEKITELEEETKMMYKELGIQSPFKSLLELSSSPIIK